MPSIRVRWDIKLQSWQIAVGKNGRAWLLWDDDGCAWLFQYMD